MNARGAVLVLAACLAIVGCQSDDPTGPHTGLSGVVLRGPTQPVCAADEPCDEPFAAGFTLRRGGLVLHRFESDAEGRFTVSAAPGAYTVVPDADAPIIGASSQTRDVTVEESGLTEVELRFDTGIR